ncbi:MAG: MoaD/ThiS family protein [Gammaproteobacteria bacterium]
MKITLKLYAALAAYLPSGSKKHTVELKVDEDATPERILEDMKIPLERTHLVLVNGIFVDVTQRKQAILKEGDILAVWPPVAGG